MSRPIYRKLKKEVREVVEWAEPLGWALQGETDSKNHWILRHVATGQDVHLPCTPRNTRTLENSKAKIRRLSGMSSESGPAARYRHESRQSGFDMRSAAREAKGRAEERERIAAEHAEWQADVAGIEAQLDEAMRALVALNPRRHPLQVRKLAVRIVELEEKLEDLTTE
ncbi:hypothetical protein [Streptomyces hydrogenans]|uniref:Uncharacterized protein n=1 Tax=Streptomyces hydrogenans TaxID=1873719 RepID=A0ABQ3PJD7_9ACTN|nr:hypothetical protein [Streptomyces hydrogenans]GHF94425.1 hypothetical protein GCM10018784_02620 [Streptomyces hydrogenans]GHI25136.1 hypothetical protein Shyd_65070 [Streptomyces hydrogenans]